jgi:aminopeptidase N
MPGWFWDTFNTTVRMPTYLIAVIIGDFAWEEASPEHWVGGKPVRV